MEEENRSILLAQVQALLEDLTRAEGALSAQAIDPELRKAVINRFGLLIEQRRDQVVALREQVGQGGPLAPSWEALRAKRAACTRLFSECLAFLEGALVRSAGLDQGNCRIADALLYDLSARTDVPWKRFTIMAEEELFPEMTEIIRLRFPEFTIWNLPVAAHEFGHFVASRLTDQGDFPIRKVIEDHPGAYLDEFFADLFAVYTLGPAFAHTCIRLRFNPSDHTAVDGDATHPAHIKRVHVILQGMREMDQDGSHLEPPFQRQIEGLDKVWRASMAAAEQPGDLSANVQAQLDSWLRQLYAPLKLHLPPAARYDGWLRAQVLAAQLAPGLDGDVQVKAEDTLPDVLNAAWLSRIRNWNAGAYALMNIERRAVQACTEVIQRQRLL